jgi:hypothetical protein
MVCEGLGLLYSKASRVEGFAAMKSLVAALAAVCAIGAAGQASAAVVFGTGSLGGLTQVHSTGSQASAPTVYGALQGGGPQVSIHSATNNLSVNGGGYAQFDGPFTTAEFFFTSFDGGFTAANFGLTAPKVNGANGVPAYLDVFAYDLDGNALPVMISDGLGGYVALNKYSLSNNLNTLNISTTSGEILSRLAFAAYSTTGVTPTPRELGDIRHIDLNAVAAPITSAVPEPATWAMMIAGFGLMGAMLRRGRRKGALAGAA